MTTTHPPTPEGPRTYQSAWQWNADGTAKLMTAEEWLEEEASVDAALDRVEPDDDERGIDDDSINRAGILCAIAAEVAQLRREKTQWAEDATRKVAEIAQLEAAVARRSPEGAEPAAAAPACGGACDPDDCEACGIAANAAYERSVNGNYEAQERVVSALWQFARALGHVGKDCDTTELVVNGVGPALKEIMDAFGHGVVSVQ